MGTSGSSNQRDKILCLIRGHEVYRTPEEEVRQALIQRMIGSLGYPRGQIAVELALSKLPHLQGITLPDCRLDLVVFEEGSFSPLLLVECKAVPLTERVLYQVVGYNFYVKAPFILVVNKRESKLGFQRDRGMHYIDGIPRYNELVDRGKSFPDLLK